MLVISFYSYSKPSHTKHTANRSAWDTILCGSCHSQDTSFIVLHFVYCRKCTECKQNGSLWQKELWKSLYKNGSVKRNSRLLSWLAIQCLSHMWIFYYQLEYFLFCSATLVIVTTPTHGNTLSAAVLQLFLLTQWTIKLYNPNVVVLPVTFSSTRTAGISEKMYKSLIKWSNHSIREWCFTLHLQFLCVPA